MHHCLRNEHSLDGITEMFYAQNNNGQADCAQNIGRDQASSDSDSPRFAEVVFEIRKTRTSQTPVDRYPVPCYEPNRYAAATTADRQASAPALTTSYEHVRKSLKSSTNDDGAWVDISQLASSARGFVSQQYFAYPSAPQSVQLPVSEPTIVAEPLRSEVFGSHHISTKHDGRNTWTSISSFSSSSRSSYDDNFVEEFDVDQHQGGQVSLASIITMTSPSNSGALRDVTRNIDDDRNRQLVESNDQRELFERQQQQLNFLYAQQQLREQSKEQHQALSRFRVQMHQQFQQQQRLRELQLLQSQRQGQQQCREQELVDQQKLWSFWQELEQQQQQQQLPELEHQQSRCQDEVLFCLLSLDDLDNARQSHNQENIDIDRFHPLMLQDFTSNATTSCYYTSRTVGPQQFPDVLSAANNLHEVCNEATLIPTTAEINSSNQPDNELLQSFVSTLNPLSSSSVASFSSSSVSPCSPENASKKRTRGRKTTSYICDHCNETFKFRATLSAHRRRHQLDATPSSSSSHRRHVCTTCGQAFADYSTHRKHVRTHTGEQPYSCNVCERRFTQSGNMKRHQRVVHLLNV